jgi:predicted Zn-dependent protease
MSRPMHSLFDRPADSRFLSSEECQALANRIFAMATGGGDTRVTVASYWAGGIRWGRNDINSGGDTRRSDIGISRSIRGARGTATANAVDEALLRTTVQRAEHLVTFSAESPDDYPDTPPVTHPCASPKIWFDGTPAVDATTRASIAAAAITPAESNDLVSAGYIQVGAQGYAVAGNDGLFRYYPFTTAQYSVTVRDQKGTGSGWAGVDFNDWARVDAAKLSHIALDKCLRSRNPVAVEPGRYTAILEPQAVCDLFAPIFDRAMDRQMAEMGMGPFADPNRPGFSKIGQRVLDPRLTVSADPMDPDCGFVPFDWNGEPYLPTKWFDQGVLRELSYYRYYGLTRLGKDFALPNSRAFRMSGGTATIEEMIAGTRRGILVTRFNNLQVIDFPSMLMQGNTRDGLWLIEHGKISKTIKNFRVTESPLFVLNNVEQLGIPQRVYRPGAPAVCPPVMSRDFSFTGLMDAV